MYYSLQANRFKEEGIKFHILTSNQYKENKRVTALKFRLFKVPYYATVKQRTSRNQCCNYVFKNNVCAIIPAILPKS